MNQVKRFREVLCPVLVRDIPKLHIVLEKLGFALKRVRHAVLRVDVPLRAVHDAEEAELQRVHPSREYVERVRARIHQVQLRQDADCPSPLRVYGPRELERIRVREVDVCGGDGKDNTGVV
jgi:hypothetical protein